MSPSLLKRAGQAVALNAAANWISLIGSLTSMVIIARILTPADYGVYVLALVAIGIPEVITSGALADSLVQRRDLRSGHINSVFLQAMVLSILFWLLIILFSPLIAHMFNNPDVRPVLIVCGVVLPIGALMSVPGALLQKELRYKEITIIDVSGTIVAAVTGILLALWWRNEWALVGMELARRLTRLTGFMFFAKWVPRATSNWTDLMELARFNLANTAAKVMGAIETMLPKSIISATLGASAVGIFNLAERLFEQMRAGLIEPYTAVAMPVASMVQDDRPALHRAIENAVRMSAFLAYPTFVGAFVVAPLAIPVVFGEQWIPAIPVFQIYMVIALRSPMTAIISGILRGVGRPDAIIWLTTLSVVSILLILLNTYQYGLVAIAFGLLAKQVIHFVAATYMIKRIVGCPVVAQFRAGATAFFASVIMGGTVWLAMTFLPTGSQPLVHLFVIVAIGVVAYVGALFGFAPKLGMRILKAVPVLLSGQPREAIGLVRGALQR